MAGHTPYRLGLDLGANSIGFALVTLDRDGRPERLLDLGVRVFPDGRDPQSGATLAVDRRTARSMRRRRDRYLLRRRDLMDTLVRSGLMPADERQRKALERLDPYVLRAAALDGPIPVDHVGRALFHLHQRRGFKSNRKTDKGDNERGKITEAAGRLEQDMLATGARTLGQFLARRHAERQSVRARLSGSGAKASYDFYPTRKLVEDEFEEIWTAQAPHHPQMTPEAHDALHAVFFRQRPLRPQVPGKCALDPAASNDDAGGFRAPWALPIAQTFRICQEVRNLEVREPGRPFAPLPRDAQDRLIGELHGKKTLSFKSMRSRLGLDAYAEFNLESDRRDKLKGDETAAVLANKKHFGPRWRTFDVDRQTAIIKRLLAEEDETALVDWLTAETGVDADRARAIAGASLPAGHCRLGRRALGHLVPLMRDDGLRYDQAAAQAYGHHSDFRTGEVFDALPYYGQVLPEHVSGSGDPGDPIEHRFGRLPNPTVHIGLNQLRRLVNALIAEHGPPTQIVLELARDLKLSKRQKDDIAREQNRNQAKNAQRDQKIAELGHEPNGLNRLRMRLWEELNPADPADRRCPFSGEVISCRRLFSDEVEIEHLLPFRDTLDDSPANKTVVMRFANRAKGKRAPAQAFSSSPTIAGFRYDWEAISLRARSLPANKRWRFAPDALHRFDAEGGFLARHLTDSAYLARMAKKYLAFVCDPNQVWVTPGRLTALLRAKWGLNSLLGDHNRAGASDEKQRRNHKHHAIDAAVIALTDRGRLNDISRAAEEGRERIVVPDPWPGFRDDLRAHLDRLVVSHKPDHGIQGKLHEETAYGLVADPAAEDGHNLVYRKAMDSLTAREVGRIRDRDIREALQERVLAAKSVGEKPEDAIKAFAAERGHRRIRLLKREAPDYLVPIRDRNGDVYKAYSAGDNLYVEVYETPDGKWQGEGVTVFQANQKGYRPAWRHRQPTARLVMRVYKGDMIKLEDIGADRVMKVHRLDVSANRFKLAAHDEAGNLDQRHAASNDEDPFRWLMASYSTLQKMRARPVRVDPIGHVHETAPRP